MSKKSRSNRILLIVFLVLLGIVVIMQVRKSSKGESNFKSELLEFSIDEVVSLELFTQSNNFEPFSIIKNGEDWTIEQQDKSFTADADLVNSMVNELAELTAVQKVAAKKDRWAEFDVTDTTGVRVVVNGDRKTLGDLYIGRFSYNQNTRKPKTFVRLAKDNDVYAVEGYLSMTFNREVNGLRNKSIFRGNRNDITRISLNYPADSSLNLVQEESGWMINGMPADSASTSDYLGSVAYLIGTEFRDDIEPTRMLSGPFSVTVEGQNMSSVEIKGMIDENGKKLVYSSLNPSCVFDGDSGELFNRIFVGLGKFLPTATSGSSE